MADELLHCKALSIGYGGRALVPPIDVTVSPGEMLLVVGRNGAGKSTWLKTVLGLIPPVAGEVQLRSPKPRLGYVPQAATLDPMLPLRARGMVRWGRVRGWGFLIPFGSGRDRQRCRTAVDRIDADEFADRSFRDLSGGQKQRVLLARLLASDPELALLDEPTASLDVTSEKETYAILARLAREQNVGVVVVTHTLGLASQHADRVLLLDSGEHLEDSVATVGTPHEIFEHPTFRQHFAEHVGDALG